MEGNIIHVQYIHGCINVRSYRPQKVNKGDHLSTGVQLISEILQQDLNH